MNAYEWGVKHGSCQEALVERQKFSSQAEWYRACDRGDWLIRQLRKLPDDLYLEQLHKAVEVIAERAVRNYALPCPATREWAEKWLSGEDRSARAAKAAEAAAEGAWAAWAAWAAGAAGAWAAAGTAAWAAAWAARAAWAAGVEAATEVAAAAAAAAEGARKEELTLQAVDIHRFIPEWPGGDE